jgi:hypothetical protein
MIFLKLGLFTDRAKVYAVSVRMKRVNFCNTVAIILASPNPFTNLNRELQEALCLALT